jgi:hypothetical protein
MNWVKFEDEKPDCWIQNGHSYSSQDLLTKDDCGEYEVDFFITNGEHTSKGWVKKGEFWASKNKVIWWCEIEPTND